VTGRLSISTEPAASAGIPQTVVFFGPRDGLSVQSPIRADRTFEIQNVSAGNYDARTLPLLIPSVSTSVVVGDTDVSGITLKVPEIRTIP